MKRLAGYGAQAEAAVEASSIAQTDIRARAALDAIVTGEFVAIEEVGRIEDETLRVFVRQSARILLVRTRI